MTAKAETMQWSFAAFLLAISCAIVVTKSASDFGVHNTKSGKDMLRNSIFCFLCGSIFGDNAPAARDAERGNPTVQILYPPDLSRSFRAAELISHPHFVR